MASRVDPCVSFDGDARQAMRLQGLLRRQGHGRRLRRVRASPMPPRCQAHEGSSGDRQRVRRQLNRQPRPLAELIKRGIRTLGR